MRSIVLSGFMATGKSTVGRLVASSLGVPFVDTDELIAKEAGISVGELFAKEGEARFREREARLIPPLLSSETPLVVALGGGSVTIPSLRHAALERTTVVTLTASPETVVARACSLEERPNLLAAAPLERAKQLLSLRKEAYAECHASLSTEDADPATLAARIVEIAQRDAVAMPLGSRSYVVELFRDVPDRLTATLSEMRPSSVVVVSDENVRAARGAWLDLALRNLSVPRCDVTLAPGESSKTIASVSRIWDEALGAGVDRSAVAIAFGGGVVGDLAGFAAATLLRGIRCVQIPTTLLSMVDSSVGGKTGFDHAAGKNLVGAFFQPSRVLVDTAHLTTLPRRERRAGYAEMVKIALACDAALLDSLEASADALESGDDTALAPLIRGAVLAKVRVVRDDERESGPRALLNLGHTVGHALEAWGGYRRWLHGEAVSIGTVLELEAAEVLGQSPPGTSARAERLLTRLGLPTRATRDELQAAWPYVLSDKKRVAAELKVPVVLGPGTARVEKIPVEALRNALLR